MVGTIPHSQPATGQLGRTVTSICDHPLGPVFRLSTEALQAQIAVSKYADGLPLYRHEAIYARGGVEIDRRLMAQWMGRTGFELEILAAHVLGEILKGPRVFADETSLSTLAHGTRSEAWWVSWDPGTVSIPHWRAGTKCELTQFADTELVHFVSFA